MAIYMYHISNDEQFIYEKNTKEINAINKLNQKKIEIKNIHTTEQLSNMFNDKEALLVFIGGIKEHHQNIIIKCNELNIPVILTHNPPMLFPNLKYNTILTDSQDTIYKIVSHSTSANLKRFCFFSFNRHSTTDRNYLSALWQFLPEFSLEDVFCSENTFQRQFEKFFEKRNSYDVIICPNDIIAIALANEIKRYDAKYFENHYVIGFMNSILSKLHSPSITSFAYETNALVQAVYTIYKANNNNNLISSINIRLHNDMSIGETWGNFITKESKNNSYFRSIDRFTFPEDSKILNYSLDDSLRKIIKIEAMLINFSLFDFEILYWILKLETITKISEILYSNTQSIHYHLNKMYSALGTHSKNEFIDILSTYIDTNNLLLYIKNQKEKK